MDLWDVVKVMWRRRWVALPLLVLTMASAVFALMAVAPDYQSNVKIGLLPPSQVAVESKPGETPKDRNSWDPGSLAEFVMTTLNKGATHRQIEVEGFSTRYTAKLTGYSVQILEIEVLGNSPEQTAATVVRLTALVDEILIAQQPGLTPSQSVKYKVFDAGEEIIKTRSVGKQALIVMTAVGLIITVGVSLAVDAIIKRRQTKPIGEARAAVTLPTVQLNGDSARHAVTVPIPSVIPPSPPQQPQAEIGSSAAAPNLDSDADNDRTIVLPLAGVSWTTAKTAKKK